MCRVYNTNVINLGLITTFDTIPSFDASMTFSSRSIDTFAFENNKYNSGKYNVARKKVNSTKKTKFQVFRFGKGDEIVNSIGNL